MANRNTKEEIQKDIDFLDEMNETLDKIDNNMNDSASIQHLRTLITDWRGELASSVPQANELLPHVIKSVCGNCEIPCMFRSINNNCENEDGCTFKKQTVL